MIHQNTAAIWTLPVWGGVQTLARMAWDTYLEPYNPLRSARNKVPQSVHLVQFNLQGFFHHLGVPFLSRVQHYQLTKQLINKVVWAKWQNERHKVLSELKVSSCRLSYVSTPSP